MKRSSAAKKKKSEAGVALLIAIFALLLISVIAIAMVVSSGTDSALKSNYRTSTGAYYAALAGVEEARGRLLAKNPDFINNVVPNYFSNPTNPTMPLFSALYIKNETAGDTVNPIDLGNDSTYPDKEFETEFGMPVTGATVQIIDTVSGTGVGPGPLFKWVRITAATEKSLGIDVDKDGDHNDPSLLYYDPSHISGGGTLKAGLVTAATPTSRQALEITALAVYPPNTQKMLQYVVVPSSLNMTFLAALTLAGNGVTYNGPNSSSFKVIGNDQPTCAQRNPVPFPAIGITNVADLGAISNGIITDGNVDSYPGFGFAAAPPPPGTPSVQKITLPTNLQTVNDFESLLQTLKQSVDLILSPTPPSTIVPGTALPSSSVMTNTNPMTIFVDGDLDLTSWHQTGYGMLVVTGQFIYDPDAYWDGVVIVIGKGIVTGSHMGGGIFNGAVLVAQTRDSNGNILPGPGLGATSVTFAGSMGGNGIQYDSCWINTALIPTKLRVLSFREIVSPN